MFQLLFTFDCEDFINNESTLALHQILELLEKYGLRGLFFLTGKVCEKLSNNPKILELLSTHEVGYHASSHSIHPTIFEYTDVESYETAMKISIQRETARINPLTGECDGVGGITLLKELLPDNEIVSFRAPGFCWSPPHLEALQKFGIRFDFSASLSSVPTLYRKITFYPFPQTGFGFVKMAFNYGYSVLKFRKLLFSTNQRILTLLFHPHNLIMAGSWDRIYYSGNPQRIETTPLRKYECFRNILHNFEIFLKRLHFLAAHDVIEVTPPLLEGKKTKFTKPDIDRAYQRSIGWPTEFFNYHPKHLHNHFLRYFDKSPDSNPPSLIT